MNMGANGIEDQYLGDGVYASFDGGRIWLDLRGQDNTTRICLEPEVYHALRRFKATVDQTLMAPKMTEMTEVVES